MKLFSQLVLVAVFLSLTSQAAAEPFELKDGDKVVWLGSTLIEREQRYGYWETALTARWPDRNITFRNLGWSGDNVYGEARLAFDITKPELGLKRMVDLTLAEKPTVIFICYGTNESFEGEAGLAKFEKGLEKLLDELKPAKARIVLMTPLPFEKLSAAVSAPTEPNRRLALYCDIIKKTAAKQGAHLADLYPTRNLKLPHRDTPRDLPITDNGMHLNEYGYYLTTSLLGTALGIDLPAIADKFVGGIENAEPLRKTIIEKNQLYFYRWRPQNETYLFGFRKHEQGRNAKEVAEFDPLIAAKEKEIARLRVPKTHRYEIVPVEKK